MTPPNRPLPPPVQEMWKTFVTTASRKDPLRTITSFDLRASQETKALAGPAAAPPIDMSDLPSLPVLGKTTPSGEPVAADFEVTGVLGEGGMGRVLLARQKSLQREVALKVLKGDESNRDIVDTLLAEAVITGSIEHPSIVPVHALGRDKNGLPVLVMKRIDGVSWRKLFEQAAHPLWSSIGVDESDRLEAHLEILMSVCNAVHYAHSRGIVHRDIKLDNVMIGGFGEVYLVDWGIALRLSAQRDPTVELAMLEPPVGTLAYMAPEMALGDTARIDARTDVYLLGATLHFILTGQPRHTGEEPLDLLLSARDSTPFDYGPSVPTELAAICNQAMHVDPSGRFSSALELRQAIASFRRHRGSLALSTKAFARMAEMGAAGPLEDHRLLQAMTECRFAFLQALEAWKGNQAARAGLDKVLERMVTYAIDHKNVTGARALLSDLFVERPDLVQKVDALAADLEAEKARNERLQALARNTDLRIGARFQLMIFSVLPISAVLSFVVMGASGLTKQMLARQLIVFPIAVTLLLVGAFFVLRKRINTAIARRAFGLLLLYPLSLLVHRIFAMTQGESIAHILTTDLVISAILAIQFGIAIFDRLAVLAAVFLSGAIATRYYPDDAFVIFLGVASFAAVILVALWTQMLRAGEKQLQT